MNGNSVHGRRWYIWVNVLWRGDDAECNVSVQEQLGGVPKNPNCSVCNLEWLMTMTQLSVTFIWRDYNHFRLVMLCYFALIMRRRWCCSVCVLVRTYLMVFQWFVVSTAKFFCASLIMLPPIQQIEPDCNERHYVFDFTVHLKCLYW